MLCKKIIFFLFIYLIPIKFSLAKDVLLVDSINEIHKKIYNANINQTLILLGDLNYHLNRNLNIIDGCYTDLIRQGKKIYNNSVNCLKFRVIIGDTQDEFLNNTLKINEVFRVNLSKYDKNIPGFRNNDELKYLNDELNKKISTMLSILEFMKK
jgi:hypothetical protein